MKKQAVQPQQSDRIVPEYTAKLCNALDTHRPCASRGSVAGLELALVALAERNVRRPNDWMPDYNGNITVRWYDGQGDHLSGSKVSLSLTVDGSSAKVSGRLSGSVGIREGASLSVDGMNIVDACEMVALLMKQIDRKPVGQ